MPGRQGDGAVLTALERFGRATSVVDWRHPAVSRLARELARGRGPLGVIRACFEWVRDRIPHTVDQGLDPVTCSASEVLREGTGFCLHGLNGVWLPAFGWYRLDPRGNRGDLAAEFDPPREILPYACRVPGERLFPGIHTEPLTVVVGR